MRGRSPRGLTRAMLNILAVMAMLFIVACDNATGTAPTATSAPKANPTAASTKPAAAPTAAVASSTTPTAASTGQKKELKIGVIGPLTGSGAVYGIALDRGVQLAASEVNEKGGLKIGGDTYTIKVISYDDKYTGDGGVAAATRLINEDKVKFIVGSISSASVLAFQSITEPAQVLVLPDSYSEEVIQPTKPFTVRIVMTSKEIAPVIFDWLKQTYPNVKRVAVVGATDASGLAVSKDNVKAAKDKGFDVVADEYFERGTTDFYPVATKVLSMNPEMIALNGGTGDVGLFIKHARELGYKGMTSTTSGQDPDALAAVGGTSVEGHVSPIVPEDDPAVQDFMKNKYQKKFPNERFNSLTLAFYDPTVALFHAMEKAQSVDPAKVRDTFIAGKYQGALGPMVFGGKKGYGIGQQYYGITFLGQMKAGKQVTLQKVDGTKFAD